MVAMPEIALTTDALSNGGRDAEFSSLISRMNFLNLTLLSLKSSVDASVH